MLDSWFSTFRKQPELFASVLFLLKTLFYGAVVILIINVVQFVRWYRRIHREYDKLQGPTDYRWLSGNGHLFPPQPDKRIAQLLEFSKKYPRFHRTWIGPFYPLIMVYHTALVRVVLKSSDPKPTGFLGPYRFGLPWIGRGLLLAEGTSWARHRRLLTPAFHFETLKPYTKDINKATDVLLSNIDQYTLTGEHFELFQYICRCTLDIICICAFSYHTDCQKQGSVHPYVKAVTELSDSWWDRARHINLYPDCAFNLTSTGRKFKKNCDFVHSVAEKIINERKEALSNMTNEDRPEKCRDFLDILLTARDEDGQGLTLKEIRDEVDTFMFEGHDTTASAISWTLYSIAEHPAIQARAQAEIDDILKGRETDDIEWEDLGRLTYLTMCIKEGLRHHAPVPLIQRELTKAVDIDGQVFPKGTHMTISMYCLHHNEELWTDPMTYDPERFSPERVVDMDPFQFTPFSGGSRNCIGQNFAMNEEKITLAKLLRRFTFSIDPDNIARKKASAVMRTVNGMMLFVKRR